MSIENITSRAPSEYNRWVITCVKLAPHLLAPQVMMQVLFAPAIVLQFLIDYSNSSAELVNKITL